MGFDYHTSLVAIYITCSILIIGTNLLLMGVILYSPALRRKPRNALIVSICVADLLLGCFVTPMFTRTLMESTSPDCHTNLALQITGDHGVFFVVGWTLVLINVLHILGMMRRRRHGHTVPSSRVSPSNFTVSAQTRPQTLPLSPSFTDRDAATAENGVRPEVTRAGYHSLSNLDEELPFSLPCPAACRSLLPSWMKILFLTASPWVVSALTVVPLVLSNASVQRVYRLEGGHLLEDVMCMLRLPRAVLLLATLLSLYLPFYLCVAALVTSIFCHSRNGRHEHHNSYHSRLNPYRDIEADTSTGRGEQAQSNGLDEVLVDGSVTDEDILQPDHSSDTQQPISSSSTPLIETMHQDPITRDNVPIPLEQISRRMISENRDLQGQDNPTMVSSNSPNLLGFCLPNAVYLMCYTPLLVHTWLHLSKVYTPDPAYGMVLFILLSRSFLMPFTWLSFPDIRQEVSELWVVLTNCVSFGPCGLRARASMSSSSSVSFSRLQENQATT